MHERQPNRVRTLLNLWRRERAQGSPVHAQGEVVTLPVAPSVQPVELVADSSHQSIRQRLLFAMEFAVTAAAANYAGFCIAPRSRAVEILHLSKQTGAGTQTAYMGIVDVASLEAAIAANLTTIFNIPMSSTPLSADQPRMSGNNSGEAYTARGDFTSHVLKASLGGWFEFPPLLEAATAYDFDPPLLVLPGQAFVVMGSTLATALNYPCVMFHELLAPVEQLGGLVPSVPVGPEWG